MFKGGDLLHEGCWWVSEGGGPAQQAGVESWFIITVLAAYLGPEDGLGLSSFAAPASYVERVDGSGACSFACCSCFYTSCFLRVAC